VQAQVVDTVKSDYVYSLLSSCDFNQTIIDGRDSAMFYSGHIKNAVYVDAFEQHHADSLVKFLNIDTLVIYCTNQRRSEILIKALISLNYQGQIIYMQDGLTAWKRNEYELVFPSKLKELKR